MHDFGHARRALVVGATLAIALSGTALSPATAHAVTQETEAQLTETQKKVEDSASSYSDAVQSVSDLQTKIDGPRRASQSSSPSCPSFRRRPAWPCATFIKRIRATAS